MWADENDPSLQEDPILRWYVREQERAKLVDPWPDNPSPASSPQAASAHYRRLMSERAAWIERNSF